MADPATLDDLHALTFGRFTLIPPRRLLLEDGRPLRLGGRAMAILIALTARAGELVGKDALLAEVWPNLVVDESALRVHITALRKALGEGRPGERYIANVSGRGYQFVCPVTRGTAVAAATPAAAPQPADDGYILPAGPARIYGREAVTAELAAALPQRRLQTIVGPGGMGKTTLALALANLAAPGYAHGARFVDLAPVSDPALVISAVATVLGVPVFDKDPLPDILAHLKDRRLLLVLDNCEQVIETAAALAEALLHGAGGLRILATSREPLRAEGEWVHRLAALETPPEGQAPTLAEAMCYPAVALFVARARAGRHDFEMTDADAPAAAEICRRLDGAPLAIELAAARVEMFGVAGLAERLDDRFALLTKGRRTALPRHQTLRATLDWSYDLLGPAERAILRRLSVFRGRFTLESATAVARGGDLSAVEVIEGLESLAAKSLLAVETQGGVARHRLLELTRDYATERLAEAGEAEAARRDHAVWMRDLLQRAESEWDIDQAARWRAVYGDLVDDVRAALDWAFSDAGEMLVGAALTASSAPLWLELSLMGEFHGRADLALARVRAAPVIDSRMELRLTTVLGHTIYETGLTPAASVALTRAAEIAQELSDPKQQLGALMGLYVERGAYGEYRTTLQLADTIAQVAVRAGHPQAAVLKDRYASLALHLNGRQREALEAADRVLANPVSRIKSPPVSGFEFDPMVAVTSVRSRILWVSGYPDQASAGAAAALEKARELGHSPSLYFALTMACCPVALWTGDMATATRLLDLIRADASTRALEHWTTWQRVFEIALKPNLEPDSADWSGALIAGIELGLVPNSRELVASAHESLLGQWVIDRVEGGDAGWCAPEVLRARGELALRRGGGAREAEPLFERALALAERQGARGWALRAATSLARLEPAQRPVLAEVYSRFDEGFGTRDLMAAKALLDL